MIPASRVADAITSHSRVVLLALVITTAAVGSGVTLLGTDGSLEAFEPDTPETRAGEYVDANFTSADENTTTAVVITTGRNVLTRESLLASLRLQREIRRNESINATLVDDEPITGVENVVASAAIYDERIDELENRSDALEARSEELNATIDRLEAGLDEVRAIQRAFEYDAEGLPADGPAYRDRKARADRAVEAVVDRVTAGIWSGQRSRYERFVESVREDESRLVELEREHGENASANESYRERERRIEDRYAWTTPILSVQFARLEANASSLEDEFETIEDRRENREPLDAQVAALANESDADFRELRRELLNGSGPGGTDVLELVASSYRPGAPRAGARMTALTQVVENESGLEMGVTDPRVIESQVRLRELAAGFEDLGGNAGRTAADGSGDGTAAEDGTDAGASGDGVADEYRVFGTGLLEEEIDRSIGDSLAIVGLFALVFVALALLVTYRDPVDIAVGLLGIGLVLLWTAGLLGWLGLGFNLFSVAVPVLLIGLSVDFSLHVVMRYRERRGQAGVADTVRGAMAAALAGVGTALVWVTVTTAMGFAANVASPLSVIREFGIAAALGILSALIVFGGLVPALKIELDGLLASRGFDRQRPAFGTGGWSSRALSAGATAARRSPAAVLIALLLVTGAGAYGAAGVDTSFERAEFTPRSPPDWMGSLPGGIAPGAYHTAETLDVLTGEFQRFDAEADVLVRGNVTDPRTLDRLSAARRDAAAKPTVYTLPTGDADVDGPLSTMRDVADDDDEFNETFRAADTDGDGVPDRDVPGLYDALFAADEEAASEVIHRSNGTYEALRLVVGTRGDASYAATAADMRAIADTVEADPRAGDVETDPRAGDVETDPVRDDSAEPATTAGAGDDSAEPVATTGASGIDLVTTTGAGVPPGVTAVATGGPVVNSVIEGFLFETLTRGFVVAFLAVFVFLVAVYRVAGAGATLGAVTLVPVTLSVAWILGTMALLGIPFNVLTVTITSLGIGLGVDYSIHVSARYRLELRERGTVREALEATVTGTGGALLGSATTTVAAFGTLGLALLPVLGQFGVITAVAIAYAFVASVVGLPALLVLWTRYLGPDVPQEE
jgi:predicted RND superfamily exporter protein